MTKELEGTYVRYVNLNGEYVTTIELGGTYVETIELQGSIASSLADVAIILDTDVAASFDATFLADGKLNLSQALSTQIDPTRVFVSEATLDATVGSQFDNVRVQVAEFLDTVTVAESFTAVLVRPGQTTLDTGTVTTQNADLIASGLYEANQLVSTSLTGGLIRPGQTTLSQAVASAFDADLISILLADVSLDTVTASSQGATLVKIGNVSETVTTGVSVAADRILGGRFSQAQGTVIVSDADLLASGIAALDTVTGQSTDVTRILGGLYSDTQSTDLVSAAIRVALATYSDAQGTAGTFDALKLVPDALQIYVAWYDSLNDDLAYATSRSVTGWSSENIDTTDNTGIRPSIRFDSSQNPRIAYRDITESVVKYAYNDGTSWTIETADSVSGISPQLGLLPDDTPFIVYFVGGTTDELKYIDRDGGSWGTSETILSTEFISEGRALEVDSSGTIHIVWKTNFNEITYATGTSGSWSTEIVDTVNGQLLGLALDSNDVPHVTYGTGSNAVKYANRVGGSWSTETVVSSLADASPRPDLDLDSNDVVHIAYENNSKVYYTENSSGWSTPLELTDTGDLSPTSPRIEFDVRDNPYVVFGERSTSPDTIQLAYKDGGSWTLGVVAEDASPTYLTIDVWSEPYTVVMDQTTAKDFATVLVLGAITSLDTVTGQTTDADLIASGAFSEASHTNATPTPSYTFSVDYEDAQATAQSSVAGIVRPADFSDTQVTAQTSDPVYVRGGIVGANTVTAKTFDAGAAFAVDVTLNTATAQASLPTLVQYTQYSDTQPTAQSSVATLVRPADFAQSQATAQTSDATLVRAADFSDTQATAGSFAGEIVVSGPNYYTDIVSPVGSVISHWKLDETSGASTATDTAGTNDGTINGNPVLESATDVYGGGTAYDFDGSGDYISVADDASLDFTNTDSFSISFWTNQDSGTSSLPISKRVNNDVGGYDFFYPRSTPEVRFRIFRDDTNSDGFAESTQATVATSSSGWVHIVGVVNRSTDEMFVYADGVSSGAVDISGFNAPVNNTTDFLIGSGDGGALAIQGEMDEVTVFSKALSASEVYDLYEGAAQDTYLVLGGDSGDIIGANFRNDWGPDWGVTTGYDSTGRMNEINTYVDANGLTHVSAWIDDLSGDAFLYSTFDGAWNDDPIPYSSGTTCAGTAVSVDSSGNPRVIYDDNGTLRFVENTGSWSTEEAISSVSSGRRLCDMITDSSDVDHVFFINSSGTLIHESNSGGSFSQVASIDTGMYGFSGVEAVMDSAGNFHVVAGQNNTNGEAYYYFYDGTWSSGTMVMDNASDQVFDVTIAVDSNDDVHIAGVFDGLDDLVYVNNVSGSFSSEETVTTAVSRPTIKIDSTDNPVISYQASGSSVGLAVHDGTSWSTETVTTTYTIDPRLVIL